MTDILRVARSQIGVVEKPGNRTPYGAWYGMDGNPWCAMFVSWCAHQAGIPTAIIPKHAYTPSGAQWFKDRRQWHSVPRVGDIVYYKLGLPRISHVGIVEKVHGPTTFTAIEGNTDIAGGRTGGQVMRKYRSTTQYTVGFGRPEYELAHPSPAVATAQTILTALGYAPGPIDGLPGKQTFDAVWAYQMQHGLDIDGEIGPQTLGHLSQADLKLPVAAGDDLHDVLTPGALLPGERVVSRDGQTVLVMQGDGNLVQYNGGRAVWSPGARGDHAVLQTDGNLVLYLLGRPMWASGTAGNASVTLYAQDDGNVVLYADGGSRPVWDTRQTD